MTPMSASGLFEPSLSFTVRPRCAACAAPNPLGADACPACGARQVTGRTVTVPALITGRGIWPTLARLCFAIARWARDRLERMS